MGLVDRIITIITKKRVAVQGSGFAALVVDMQDNFLKEHDTAKVKRLIKAQEETLTYCEHRKIPLFVLEYEGEGSTIPEIAYFFKHMRFVIRIRKTKDDGFLGTELSEELEARRTTDIIGMGVNRTWCVYGTLYTAAKRYGIYTAKTITADRRLYANDQEYKRQQPKVQKWYEKNTHYYNNHKQMLRAINARITTS